MFARNVDLVLSRLNSHDKVLDIGGWARPFNRADFVMDAEPYETRGYYGVSRPAQGGDVERFSKETWIQRDICEKTPYPFRDKELDFVTCSHTLEDIRDPLWVCSEMMRIAKAGYIEVPSRLVESCRGIERNQVGWSHHRWLIDIDQTQCRVSFMMKYHMIHGHFRFSLPASYFRSLAEEGQVAFLFWNHSFTFGEKTIHGLDNIAVELDSFVRGVRPYSRARLAAANLCHVARSSIDRILSRVSTLV